MSDDAVRDELATVSEPETIFHAAIDWWWSAKEKNATDIERRQGGTRDTNLRGDTMDGFRDVIVKVMIEQAGVNPSDIFTASQLGERASNLPSFFRATKNWDVVICKNALTDQLASGQYLRSEKLIAAIEFKSQDKSIGNNQNNRIEESIGNAEDFWASYERGNFSRLTPRPWLEYLFVGRYADGDETKPVKMTQPLIPVDEVFVVGDTNARLRTTKLPGVSYAERYRIFLERMLGKQRYDGACFLVTHEAIKEAASNYRVLFPALSGAQFVDNLVRHVRAYYPD